MITSVRTHAFALAALALLIPAAAGSGAGAQEKSDAPPRGGVLLKAVYAKGDTITAASTTKFEMEIATTVDFGGGDPMTVTMNNEMDMEVNYSSEVLEVDEKAAIRKERREYTKARAKMRNSSDFGGGDDDDGKERMEDLPFEGKSFELTKEEDGTKVVPKGDAKDIAKSQLAMIQIHQGMERILPEGEVAPGDRWSIEGKRLKEWIESQVGVMKFKSVEGSIECTLKGVEEVEGRRVARVDYLFDLEASVDPTKMGRMDDDEDEDEDMPRMKVEITFRIQKGRGHFLFNVDEGSSLSCEMKAGIEVELEQQFGEHEIGGKGKGSVELRNTWRKEARKAE